MRASARTTQEGTRRIRRCGCAAIGPLARNRPNAPDASASRQSTKPVTEAEAIRLAQTGDAAAFEFLYHLHGRRVYALCLRMVNNPSDAEDLMQEAFLQLFRKIGTFRGESAFSTWLHRMTVNVVLMRLRKKSLPVASLEETTDPDDETGGPRKDIGAPDLRLSGAVDRVNLERSVEKLPPGTGRCFCFTTFRATSTTRSRILWDVQWEIRSRNCTKRVHVCGTCSRKRFVNRHGRIAMRRKPRRGIMIELQCVQFKGV